MFELYDLYLVAPELSLVLVALTVMVVDLFVKRRIVTVTVALIGLIRHFWSAQWSQIIHCQMFMHSTVCSSSINMLFSSILSS